jgi:hypothetical protein
MEPLCAPGRNILLCPDANAQEGIKVLSANDKAHRYTIRVPEAR